LCLKAILQPSDKKIVESLLKILGKAKSESQKEPKEINQDLIKRGVIVVRALVDSIVVKDGHHSLTDDSIT
jgi:hypothetical protein